MNRGSTTGQTLHAFPSNPIVTASPSTMTGTFR